MTTLQDLRQTLSHFADGRRKRRQLRREFAQLAAMGSLDAVLADVGLVRSRRWSRDAPTPGNCWTRCSPGLVSILPDCRSRAYGT